MDTAYVVELMAGVPNVELSVVNNRTGAISARYTDGNGYCNHGLVGSPGDLCSLQTNGYRFVTSTAAPVEGPQYLYLPSGSTAALSVTLTLEPAARSTGRELTANLRTEGWYFRGDDGRRFTAIQCSDFNLLNRWQHGENIQPVLQQRADCGFNMLRVWTAYDIPGIGTFLDIDYARVPAFVALCAKYGLYVEFCGYTGINDPGHWPHLIDAALACPIRPLLELVNELDQNTNEPDPLGRVFLIDDYTQPPAPLLSAHGSNGSEHAPVRGASGSEWWSYETVHLNDAYEWQRKVSHWPLECQQGAEGIRASNVPVLANENTRYIDKAQNIDIAGDAAAAAALLCAGSCYHSQRGKTSERWDGDELLAAQAWARGAASVDLDCQQGNYYRHEPGVYLRVYDRPTSGHYCVVEISKAEGPA